MRGTRPAALILTLLAAVTPRVIADQPKFVDVRGIVVGVEQSDAGREAARALESAGGATAIRRDQQDQVQLDTPGGSVQSMKTAWEAAYDVGYDRGTDKLKSGVRYVQPRVTYDVPVDEPVAGEYCPGCTPTPPKVDKCGDPIPAALADSEWSLDALHGANVLEAHRKFAQAASREVAFGPRREGEPACFPQRPGDCVWIGHPDTGYRKHPEVWPGIRSDDGWNFLTDREDPLDALLTGTLRNPGHGTKTASVIISPGGSQLGSSRWVTGVAPGAQLMPLRVAEGVVLFPRDLGELRVNGARAADAIRAAAGPNRQKAKHQARVISISMGGLPGTRDLADAIAYAERRGVIVIAAAGNKVPGGRVVFPAAFETPIAMAATNYNNVPWKCSSRGRRVTISAPGESVWAASSPSGNSCVQASTGTSFATATMAGIAALWLSYPDGEHQRQLSRLDEVNALPRAFRDVLARATRTPPGWDTANYGPGIVDAVKVIEADLSEIPSTRGEALREDWCPTNPDAFVGIRGIFSDASNGRERVRALFKTNDLCRVAVVADEFVLLSTVDPAVATAIVRISGPDEPRSADYEAVRRAVRNADASDRLRSMM